MDEDTMQTNLNTIKEMVLDEEKLVTYVSLSKDLCIHVNDSKNLILTFIKNTKQKEPDINLNISYIISGMSEENKARTTVVSEKNLDDIKKTFKNLFFKHIYSVSKGLPVVDNVALTAVNRFEDLPLCIGLIKNNSCVKRSADEIGNLKSISQSSAQIEQRPVKPLFKKDKEESKLVLKKDENKVNVTKVHESKSEPSIKSEIPSPNKEKSKTDNKKNNVKTQKGIAGFFNKSNSVPSKTLSKETKDKKQDAIVKKEQDPTNLETDKMEVDEEVCEPKKKESEKKIKMEEMESQIEKETPKKEQVNGKSKNKPNEKLNQIKKNAKVDKKRKRVLHVSDSESEEERDPFVDEPEPQEPISDDEIPPTPTVNTVKITTGIVNPRKRRKIVDKTYTDEEGFILTKKEEVYESCSDNEEELSIKENIQDPPINHVKQEKLETSPKHKKNAPKNNKKKISPPQKGKQATLMNFFKKV